MRSIAQMLSLMLLMTASPVLANSSAIQGTWLSGDGDGLIGIKVTDTLLRGVILGSRADDPGRPQTDVKNPDPELRDRPLIGLDLFSGFTYDGDGAWSGGSIYDPNSGKTYRCKLQLVDNNTLKVRGFIGISLLGRTEIWKRQDD